MWLQRQMVRAVLLVVILIVLAFFAYRPERRVRRLLRQRKYQYALVLFAGGGLPAAVKYLYSQGLSVRKAGERMQRLVRLLGVGAKGRGPFGEAILAGSGALPARPDEMGNVIPSQPHLPVHCCGHVLYQPDDVLRHRADASEALAGWIKAVDESVHEFGTFIQFAGQALSLTGVVRVGQQSRFWLDFQPDGLPAKMKQGLMQRLVAIKPPPVHGPIAFLSHLLLWGGPDESTEPFTFVPRDWLGPIGTLPDDPLRKVWPPER